MKVVSVLNQPQLSLISSKSARAGRNPLRRPALLKLPIRFRSLSAACDQMGARSSDSFQACIYIPEARLDLGTDLLTPCLTILSSFICHSDLFFIFWADDLSQKGDLYKYISISFQSGWPVLRSHSFCSDWKVITQNRNHSDRWQSWLTCTMQVCNHVCLSA